MFEKVQELNSYVVIKSSEDTFLILRRKGTDFWEFPGGGIEWGESPEISGVREVEEEVGLKVSVERLVTVTSAVFKKVYGSRQLEKHAVYVVYLAVVDKEKKVVLGEEHEEAKWVDKKELVKYRFGLNAEPVIKLL